MGIDDAHAVANVKDAEAGGWSEEGGGEGHEVGFPGHHDAVGGGVEDAVGAEGERGGEIGGLIGLGFFCCGSWRMDEYGVVGVGFGVSILGRVLLK